MTDSYSNEFPRIKFAEIDVTSLIPNKKYKIMDTDNLSTKTMISLFVRCNTLDGCSYLIWGKTTYILERWDGYIFMLDNPDMILSYSSGPNRKIYQIVSSKTKIQNSMELRAVNKILQNIIGDITFNY